ncbi:MAG TPA: hypothetical protein VMH02_05450 [Verrucomicrobiae bacterium]|nr:hypothetical protein [Verrucomicrobiae bacterium]
MRHRLHCTVPFAGTAAQADARIERYLAARRDSHGVTRVELRVPLEGVAPVRGLALEHCVRVDACRGRDDQNLNDVIRMAWAPEGGGPFPRFEGTLVTFARSDEPDTSEIELDGWYEPPLGDAGELFEETVGHAIAERTARALLEEVARG